MKYFCIFLSLFFIPSGLSNELTGSIWSLSGVGCRDADLDPASHVSKTTAVADVTAGIINFESDTQVRINQTVQGRETTDTGTYKLKGKEITFSSGGSSKKGTAYLINDRIILIGSTFEAGLECCGVNWVDNWKAIKRQVEQGGEETWQEHIKKHNLPINEWTAASEKELKSLNKKCQKENPFVYVLGKVN